MDEHQQAAAYAPEQFVQIHGGPGSGKTSVLAARIVWLLKNGVLPEGVVALTYTNHAGESLRGAVAQLLGDHETALKLTITTFHTFCSKLVNAHGSNVGLGEGWRMQDFLDAHNERLFAPVGGLGFELSRIYRFETALRLGCQLAGPGGPLENKVNHVLVDEFQDCDEMQFKVLERLLLANPQMALTVVGDPNQEIYAFVSGHLKNAFGIMLEKLPETKQYYLKYNYRSDASIVNYCNNLEVPDPCAMAPVSQRDGLVREWIGGPETVANQIKRLDVMLGDIAVLLRTNIEVRQYTNFLQSAGLPVSRAHALRSFLQQPAQNFFVTLMKWCESSCNAHLLQLLYSRHAKLLSPKDVKWASEMPSALLAVPERKRSKLQHAREEIIQCRTPHEVLQTAGKLAIELLPPRRHLDSVTSIKQLQTLLSDSGETYAERPGEALQQTLRHLFAIENRSSKTEVQVLTMHAAKSRQWPVVFVDLRSRMPVEPCLQFVAASRAEHQLYVLNSRKGFLSPAAAAARDGPVFAKLVARRVLTRVIRC